VRSHPFVDLRGFERGARPHARATCGWRTPTPGSCSTC
jgi:hypothetical protein